MPDVTQGELLAEGKTKRIWTVHESPKRCIIESKDDITAGDGAKHDVIQGKGALATRTTSNVFRLLNTCGVPTAFMEELDATKFLAILCDMIPYEVVVRREAHGSYLKRHPHIKKGHVFPRLVLEFFLKTSHKKWSGLDLPKDDPLVQFSEGKARLFLPDQPMYGQTPFAVLENFPLKECPETLEQMGAITRKIFLILEKAWQLAGYRLADFKVEFGKRAGYDTLYLADVIDNDSWRVLEDGAYIDKQLYRDGANLKKMKAAYRHVRDLTERFSIPRQQIILWRGSKHDDFAPFENAVWEYCDTHPGYPIPQIKAVTCSLHKEPVRTCQKLARLVQEAPDSVVIAYAGRSNGAGPTLSAQTHVPVITVPASYKEFPQDVWSSLRAPSATPVMTVLDPANAVLAALQILAMRNPAIYAALRMRQEERLCNVVEL